MNILLSRWLPVALADGTVRKLAPVELPTSGAVRVAHPRPDFCALGTELLVALYQTLCAPENKLQRLAWRRRPEQVDLSAMRAAAASFELMGDGPRFLQCPPVEKGTTEPVSGLVFEAPMANTLEKNTDIFVSRNQIQSVCPHCAPLGLYLNQSRARGAGQGYKTNIRGGSALTALVQVPDSLWATVLLNLLPAQDYESRFAVKDAPAGVYPWTAGGEAFIAPTARADLAGSHAAYWWCPVALRLVEEANEACQACDLCGEIHDVHFTQEYRSATKARAPAGLKHPLTVYRRQEANEKQPKEANEKQQLETHEEFWPLMAPRDGQHLEDWLSLSMGRETGAHKQEPPAAVALLTGTQAADTRLWTFGASTNKAEFLHWHDELSPTFVAADDRMAEVYRGEASRLLVSVLRVREALRAAVFANPVPAVGPHGIEPSRPHKDKNRKAAMPLRQSPQALLATFEGVARDALMHALRSIDPELGAVTADESRRFDLELRRAAWDLFERNLQVNPAEVRVLARLLYLRGSLHKKLFPPAKPPKAAKKPSKKAAGKSEPACESTSSTLSENAAA